MNTPKDAMAAYAEGIGLMAAGELEKAAGAFARSVGADPEFAMGFLGLSQVRDRQGRVDESIEAVRKALELTPDDPLAHTEFVEVAPAEGSD